ncbi:hypothetical protein C8J56DRAFT_1127072 [Mycena floridula]|nr:hypothetical protein C8J56DRAFT_1127072 [Mycena floridula]
MSAHIPLALSLLHTVATQYPGFQKAQPTPPMTMSLPPQLPVTTNQQSSQGPLNPSQAANVAPSAVTPPASTTSNLCDNCHLRPKHSDGTKIHAYCSKSCAKQVGTPAVHMLNAVNCDFCHIHPKYHDGRRTHPFCGKACATSAAASATSGGNTKGTCQAPGCQKPAFKHPNGTVGDYCCMSHKTLTETSCLLCHLATKLPNSHFCSQTCIDEAEKKGPMLLEIPPGHVTFKSVADQFKASWRHSGSTCPPVRRIYKVLATPASLSAYNAYRAAVEGRGHFVASGRSAGNENRRWHGTRRECFVGDKGQTQFCASPSCSLCCILRTSFDLSMWGKKTGWGRFGKGLYTSSTSSKSNDYSHNECKSPFKAILLNKVVVGKGLKLKHDDTSLTQPPGGYDSVLAEKGGSLNYDELVVYTNDAIRPSYLIIYEP